MTLVKNPPANAGDARDACSISWRRKWQPTAVFLPGKSHGQRSLEGYSPWGHNESDPTEQLTLSLSLDKCSQVFEALSISLGT